MQSNQKTFYHGTSKEFQKFENSINWFSSSHKLANDYALLREDISGGSAYIIPVHISEDKLFDADKLSKTITLETFLGELAKQSEIISGKPYDRDKMIDAVKLLRNMRKLEESGPHYSPQDFWFESYYKFGMEGKKRLDSLFNELGFNGIKFKEENTHTIGIIKGQEITSSISGEKLNCKAIKEELFKSKNNNALEEIINRKEKSFSCEP